LAGVVVACIDRMNGLCEQLGYRFDLFQDESGVPSPIPWNRSKAV
jgi:hypothetical protein